MADVKLQVALQAQAKAKAAKEASENAKAAGGAKPANGRIRVRLIRAMYSREGVYIPAGIVELPEDEVPTSAVRLSTPTPPVDVAPQQDEDADE